MKFCNTRMCLISTLTNRWWAWWRYMWQSWPSWRTKRPSLKGNSFWKKPNRTQIVQKHKNMHASLTIYAGTKLNFSKSCTTRCMLHSVSPMILSYLRHMRPMSSGNSCLNISMRCWPVARTGSFLSMPLGRPTKDTLLMRNLMLSTHGTLSRSTRWTKPCRILQPRLPTSLRWKSRCFASRTPLASSTASPASTSSKR